MLDALSASRLVYSQRRVGLSLLLAADVLLNTFEQDSFCPTLLQTVHVAVRFQLRNGHLRELAGRDQPSPVDLQTSIL